MRRMKSRFFKKEIKKWINKGAILIAQEFASENPLHFKYWVWTFDCPTGKARLKKKPRSVLDEEKEIIIPIVKQRHREENDLFRSFKLRRNLELNGN